MIPACDGRSVRRTDLR